MNKIDFTHFHNYAELTSHLKELAIAYPDLCALHSAGTSPAGRELWVMELGSNKGTPLNKRPAYFIKGNHHAGEVTGCAASLYTIWYLLTNYGVDSLCTRVLDERTLYVMPRITVDGSEVYLTSPKSLRSSPSPWPEAELQDGMYFDDVDGDGHILQMRLRHTMGDWKVSDKDPRLMARRAPDDLMGEFYFIYPEAMIKNFDGYEVKMPRPLWSVDFNRNYPTNWEPDHRQRGGGNFPFSQPEIKAVADWFIQHPNIGGSMSYHTTGGVILRPMCTVDDTKVPKSDLQLYKTIGDMGTEETGYPVVNVYRDFTYNPERPEVGSYLEWVYEALGVMGFEIELWDMPKRAGIEKRGFRANAEKTDKEREEDGLKLLAWNDQELGGAGFVNWRPFTHPQLGQVEIGGWLPKTVRQNIPPHLLEEEIKGNCIFTLRHALALPEMRITSITVEKQDTNTYVISMGVANSSYLPTNVTEMALKIRSAKPVTAELILPEGMQAVGCKLKQELGHLPGFAQRKIEWAVKGHGQVTVRISGEKAGQEERVVQV